MNDDLYELVALFMRYFFAAIMVLIVLRAWKISVVDSRRAKSLRRLAPETGFCGEFLIVSGDGRRVREGMRYPVIREGLIGSSRKADVRIRSASVRRAHAFFERTQTGLRIRAQGHARMYDGAGAQRREAMLGDGDRMTFGKVELMLVLTDGQAASGHEQRADLFDVVSDVPRGKTAQSVEPDAVFDSWEDAASARQQWDEAGDEADEPEDAWDVQQGNRREKKKTGDDFFDV